MRATAKVDGILAAAAALAGGTSAYAEIIHFVNPPDGEPGHFPWHWVPKEGIHHSWLDITRAADDQPEVASGNAVDQAAPDLGLGLYGNGTFLGAQVAVSGSGFGHDFTAALKFGDPIDGQTFDQTAFHQLAYYGDYGTTYYGNFEQGVRSYIGVKTASGNYGWIAVERGLEVFGLSFTAFAWAYETEAGQPIFAGQVPAPGTLALLAFGALGRSRKRD